MGFDFLSLMQQKNCVFKLLVRLQNLWLGKIIIKALGDANLLLGSFFSAGGELEVLVDVKNRQIRFKGCLPIF